MTNTALRRRGERDYITLESVFAERAGVNRAAVELQMEGMMKRVLVHFTEQYIGRPDCNSFEVFGVDFLIDEGGRVHLLEVNANPDFNITDEAKRALYKRPFDLLFKFLAAKLRYIEEQSRPWYQSHTLTTFAQVEANVQRLSCDFNAISPLIESETTN